MPTFDTPGPISVRLDLVIGDIRLVAGERADTVVAVRPNGPGEADRLAAERTRVEYADGELLVAAPKRRKKLFGRANKQGEQGGIQLTIELPSGSGVRGQVGLGHLRSTGRLGECRFSTSTGDIELAETGPVQLVTAAGTVAVAHAGGNVQIVNVHGAVRLGQVEGTATIKNLNGVTTVADVSGALSFTGTNGDLSVDRAGTDVEAKTASGNLRVREVVRGEVVLETTAGSVEIGIREGTSAWIDAQSDVGGVRNELADAEPPGETAETVKLRARTNVGTIDVRRSLLS